MKVKILNRNFEHPADGWYMIERAGEHPNARAKIVQIIDDKACQSIVNRFNQEADKPGFPGMLIDHDHLKYDETQSTESFGWLMRLQNRADGIYGQIRWTDTGQAAVDGGRFRFFSTEYDPADFQVLNDKQPRQVRPLRLDGLTLTNMNNNKGQKPITNRNAMLETDLTEEQLDRLTNRSPGKIRQLVLNGDFPGHEFHGNQYAEGSGGSKSSAASGDAHAATRDAMSSGSGDDHAVASSMHKHAAAEANKAGNKNLALYHDTMSNMHHDEAIKAWKGGGGKARNRLSTGRLASQEHQQQHAEIPMKSVIALLGLHADASEPDVLAAVNKIKNRVTTVETEQVDADLAAFHDRIPEERKDYWKKQLITNRAETLEVLEELPPVKNRSNREAPTRVHNRNAKGTEPVDANAGGEPSDEMEMLEKQREEIEKIRNSNRSLSYEQARNQVRNRKPELFGLPARGASAN